MDRLEARAYQLAGTKSFRADRTVTIETEGGPRRSAEICFPFRSSLPTGFPAPLSRLSTGHVACRTTSQKASPVEIRRRIIALGLLRCMDSGDLVSLSVGSAKKLACCNVRSHFRSLSSGKFPPGHCIVICSKLGQDAIIFRKMSSPALGHVHVSLVSFHAQSSKILKLIM